MAGKVNPIPDGYRSLTPYISVKGASEAIAFYAKAFGAREISRILMPDGIIGHAELRIGDSILMLAEEMPDRPDALALSPTTLGHTTFGFNLYVEDVDAAFQKAVDAGAEVRRPIKDQLYGDRSGLLQDPFGHIWTLATHVEDVSPEEMERRLEAETAGAAGAA